MWVSKVSRHWAIQYLISFDTEIQIIRFFILFEMHVQISLAYSILQMIIQTLLMRRVPIFIWIGARKDYWISLEGWFESDRVGLARVGLENNWSRLRLPVWTRWRARLLDWPGGRLLVVRQLLRRSRPGCRHGHGLPATIRSADEVKRVQVAGSGQDKWMRHVHAGTTDPPKEGANARSWMAPATAKTATVGSWDRPEWNKSAGGVEERELWRRRWMAGKRDNGWNCLKISFYRRRWRVSLGFCRQIPATESAEGGGTRSGFSAA